MSEIQYDENGLVVTVVQHATTGEVRMVAWSNAEAVAATESTGYAHFYSRSRKTLWKKGETSGNTLRVVSVSVDCDGDTVLIRALPDGPTCHTGADSCFADAPFASVLAKLEDIVRDRRDHPKDGSYTNQLLEGGISAIGAKVTEEAAEVVQAATGEGPQRVAEEAGDLLYHLAVLLVDAGVSVESVSEVLAKRHQ